MMRKVDGNNIAAINLAARGGNVRPTVPTDMGGDGRAYDLGEVVGRQTMVTLTKGVEVKIGAKARVVQTTDGQILRIPGGSGQPVGVFYANKIAPELKGKTVAAVGGDRRKRKRNLLR